MVKVFGTNTRHVMSCSTLTRDRVVNSKGEDLGTVEDIMIHIDSGRIAYVVLSFGGILGIGDKLFAVPWEALALDEDNKQFVFNIEKEKLENAPGFDKDHWPDSADPKFWGQMYSYYGFEEPSWISESAGFVHGKEREEGCVEMGTC